MKIAPSRIEAFVARPDSAARAILVYGPDAGLVRERAERLCRSVVENPADPFRVVELAAASLRDDPARLGDAAAQIALTGGRRVIRVREATDGSAGVFDDFLAAPAGDALVVVEAGDLPARSKLRGVFEAADNAAAVPCYGDTAETIAGLVRSTLREAKLDVSPDALDYLTERLGNDRGVTRRELEKLVLYMGDLGGDPGGDRGGQARAQQVRLEDAEACIGDSVSASIDDAVLAAADGDRPAVARALARAFGEGESAVGVIRAGQRHFQRLHLAAGQVATGDAPERVVDAIRPKVFWKIRGRLIAQLRIWPAARVAQALERLTAAEIACKTTGMPDEAIATRCLLELAGAAERPRR